MADKNLNDIVQQLVDALSERLGSQQSGSSEAGTAKKSKTKPKITAEEASELNIEDLQNYIKEQERWSEEIKRNTRIAQEAAEETIDSEEIIAELKQERLNQIKEEFKENQKLLLQFRKKLDDAEKAYIKDDKAIADLKAKIKLVQDEATEQAKILESAKKEEEIKENISSIGKEIFQGALKYGQELEKHIMNISKLNGGYAEHGEKLREANVQIYQATAGTGIMFEEANAAFAGLSQNFIGLTTQSQEAIKTMAVGTAQLTKVGVDAGSAAKGMDSLVNAMGKAPQQAYKIQESFVQMAAKNRLALGAVSQAFAENSSRFVGYGEQMTKVLDGLAEQSLKTGIQINKLVGIAQGFDTFEDASKKVGNLNALLGGDYFNSVEMLTASDEERIKLLKEGVLNSGMQWESMNRFQKMAIANAAGITDLNEASKMFGETSLHNTKQQAEAAAVQKTLAEQAESVSTSMDKMKSVLNGVIIALDPLVSLFGMLVTAIVAPAKYLGQFGEYLGGLGEKLGGFPGKVVSVIGKVVSVVGGLFSLYLIWQGKNLLLGGSFKSLSGSMGQMMTKIKSLPKLMSSALKSTPTSVPGAPTAAPASPLAPAAPTAPAAAGQQGPGRFTSFINNINPTKLIAAAAALLIVAAALFVMAKALQEFAVVAEKGAGTAGGAVGLAALSIGILVAALIALDKVKGEVLKGSVILGIMALVLLGFGIALAKFVNIDWKVIAGIGLILVALTLAMVGLGLAISGPQALLFAAGLGVIGLLAITLGLLGVALVSIVKAIESAAPALSNLANSFKLLFEIQDLEDKFSSIESFLSQLSNIDYEPINNLANAIGALATNLEKLAAVSSSMNIQGSVETTTTQNIKSIAEQVGKTANSVGESAAASSQQSLIPVQQTTTFVPLVVEIDGKKIIEVLRKDIEKISGEQTSRIIEAVGTTRSAEFAQYSPVTQ